MTVPPQVADASGVPLSRTQIVLYLGLIAGVIAGLAYGLPQWQLITFGLIVGIVDIVTSRGKPPPRAAAVWPWQRPGFWAVLALLVALPIALRYLGAPVGIVLLICSLGFVPYGFQVGGEIARKRRQLSGRIPRPSGMEDWAILIGSIALCVLGLLLVRQDWRTAVVTSTFFGACALTLFTVIYRKRRERRWRASVVRVTGGVDIPVSAYRLGFIALGCFVVGAVMFFVGVNDPLLIRLSGAFIGLVGVALAIAHACGYFTRQLIRFDPDAFTIGERGFRCRIGWDNITEVAEFEFARNPFVGVWLRDLEAVIVEPANRFDSFLSRVANDRTLMSADVVIAPRNFGIDGAVLAAALKRYAIDRSARAELVARGELLSAPGASK